MVHLMNNQADGIRRINPPRLFDGSPYGMSQGTVDAHTRLVFLSGQVSWDETSQVRGSTYAEQTDMALRNLEIALEAAGSNRDGVLHLRIYLRGECGEHMSEVAPRLRSFFSNVRPAVTGIGVASLATPDTLVELEAVAKAS